MDSWKASEREVNAEDSQALPTLLAAASPDDDFLQAKAKFHTEVLDDIRSQIQAHVNLPYEATSDEELLIALTEQADAAYPEEGYDASARCRCYAEVLSESLPQ